MSILIKSDFVKGISSEGHNLMVWLKTDKEAEAPLVIYVDTNNAVIIDKDGNILIEQ